MRRVHHPPAYPLLFATEADVLRLSAPSDDKRAALEALARAAARGFLYCEAVFVERGDLLSYDGLCEKAHPTSGALNWGRGQRVTERNFFRDGKLVADPDYVFAGQPEAEWEQDGYRCYSWYVAEMGHRCGYVEIPEGHPWHRKDYNACLLTPPCAEAWCGHSIASLVMVHGGVTWSDENWRGAWCLGFDCAHSGDRCDPEFARSRAERYGQSSYLDRDGHYWTLNEVTQETNRLAAQIAAAATGALIAAPEGD